jgi:citrate lyase subunit beta/citryl-CoA lyase
MLAYLSICVAAARAYGVEILDGVFNDFSDTAGFRAECEQGRDFGMDGKSLIHPSQVAICNEVFSPPQDEIAWARKILDAFAAPENATKGVLQIEGRMVERMHAEMAYRTVKIAEAIAQQA